MTLKGTVGTSLMNLFKPVLVMVNNAIVVINQFAKAVGDSLGKILGWRYEVGSGAVALDDAADYAEDLEGGLGGAGKAAKDLKRQLQGFDELNNLTSNDPSGGGGGGGGGAGGVGAGGASDLAGRWVKEESLFESEWDTWFKLGRGISEAWTEGLNSIPWDSVYEKAREFGKGFADFLNGLFTPELFGAVGRTIAGALNTAIYTALSFGENLNWKQIGEAIASGINNFMSTYDFAATGRTIQVWSKGILDMLITAVEEIKWEDFGSKLTEFITNVDLPGIASKASKLAIKLINGLSTAISNADWSKIGETLGNTLKNLNIPELVSKLAGLAGQIIGALGQAFIALAKEDPLSAGILAIIGAAKLSGLTGVLSNSIMTALGGSGSMLSIAANGLKIKLVGATLLLAGFSMAFSGDTSLGGAALSTASVGVGTLMITGNPYLAIAAATIAGSINLMKIDNPTVEKYIAEQYAQPGGLYGDAPPSTLDTTNGKTLNLSDYERYDEVMNAMVIDTARASENMMKWGYTAQDVGMIIGQSNQESVKSYKESFKYIERAHAQATNTTKSAYKTQKKDTKEYTTYAQTQIQKMTEQNAKAFATGASTSLALTKSFSKDFQEEHRVMTGGASQYWDNMAGTNIAIDRQTCQNILSNNRNFSRDFISNMAGMSTESTNKVTTMKTAVGTLINTMQTKGTTDVTTLANAIKTQTGSANTTSQTNANAMKTNLVTNLGAMNTSTSTNTASMLKTIQTWSTNAKNTVANTKASANFGVKYEAISNVQNAIAKLKNAWTDKTASFKINTSTTVGSTTSIANDILGKIKQAFSWSPLTLLKNAANAIRFFATGGVAENATLGVFGEAGAEAIVPLERNTKWLGRMSNMLADELAYKKYTPTTYSAPKYTGSTSVVAQTSERSEQATAEQNALLREEVELLRQIAGKEFSVSSRDVFNSVQNESENYYNRTGNSPFIF